MSGSGGGVVVSSGRNVRGRQTLTSRRRLSVPNNPSHLQVCHHNLGAKCRTKSEIVILLQGKERRFFAGFFGLKNKESRGKGEPKRIARESSAASFVGGRIVRLQHVRSLAAVSTLDSLPDSFDLLVRFCPIFCAPHEQFHVSRSCAIGRIVARPLSFFRVRSSVRLDLLNSLGTETRNIYYFPPLVRD